jgi:hypothetical protein
MPSYLTISIEHAGAFVLLAERRGAIHRTDVRHFASRRRRLSGRSPGRSQKRFDRLRSQLQRVDVQLEAPAEHLVGSMSRPPKL